MRYSVHAIRFFLLFLLFDGFCGCKKASPSDKPLPNSVDSFVDDPGGTLYINADDILSKVEVRTGVTDWSTSLVDGFGSYNSPLNFDSGYVYFGGLGGLTAYNYQTGATIWMGYIPFEPGASLSSGYRATPVQDSLVFYTGPTGVFYGGARMYCAYQKNGSVIWSNLIDSNQSGDFNGIPFVTNGNVVVLTRDGAGNTQIACFVGSTGRKIWATADNNELSSKLYATNDYVYSTSGQHAYCYSAKDGSLQWQTDMQFPGGGTLTYTFLDNNKMIVCRNYSQTSNTIKEFNASTGSPITSFELDVPGAEDSRGYAYGGNVLYTVNLVNDSIEMHALDLTTNVQKWKYRYFHASELTAVVTPKYVIIPGGIADSTGLNGQSEMIFLNLNGTLAKEVPAKGFLTDKFLYVDSSGVVYKQADF